MNRKPATLLLYAFVLSIPLDQIAIEGIGNPSIPIGILFAVAASASTLVSLRIRRMPASIGLLCAFAAWSCATIFWSVDPSATLRRVGSFALLASFVLLLWQTARDEWVSQNMAVAFMVGAAGASVATVVAYLRGESYGLTVNRYAGAGYDPNDLCVTLAVGLVLSWSLVTRSAGWRRTVAVGYIPLALVAVGLTASRGGALAVAVALLVIPASGKKLKLRTKVVSMVVAAAAAVALAVFVPTTSWERFATVGGELRGGSMANRVDIWAAGFELLRSHWVAGVGAGAFATAVQPLIGEAVVAHNTYLGIAVELGVPGFCLFAAAWIAAAARVRRMEPSLRPFAWGLIGSLAIGAASLSWEFRKTTWFVFVYVLQLAAVFTNSRATASKRAVASGSAVAPAR